MAKKRFRQRGRRRGAQRDQRLVKQVRELYDGGDDDWTQHLGDDLAENPAVAPGRGSKPKPDDAELPEPDGARRNGTVVSLASGLAWIEPVDPSALIAEENVAASDLPLLCILPTALARDQQSRIAVGDRIIFARHGEDHRVIEIEPRRTYLARPDPLNPRQRRVVVANVDIIVQVASVRQPALRPALIDRYLVAIQQGGAEPILCVNKIDLIPESTRDDALAPLAAHRNLLRIVPTSAETGEGIETLRELLVDKLTAFVGHSGVGKSSLINALQPSAGAKTGAVSEALAKGRHTTTRSNLYELDGGIRIVDTPGIRELGLADLSADELRHYFPDLAEIASGCRFTDCSHDHEPDCAVRAAAASGDLAPSRYATYRRILASLEE